MSHGMRIAATLSRKELAAIDEQQLIYAMVEVVPQGGSGAMPKLPLYLCLVIDRSSSMRGDRLMQVKDAAHRIIDQLGPEDFFAVVTFNDRAEVAVPAQRVRNRDELKRMVSGIEAAGGTEMAQGMALALQEVQRMLGNGISRMLLLTDGRTYGDEGQCVEVARRAQRRGIGLTALGIGTEWNEDLLETLTAHENSRTQYITSAQEISQIFQDEVKRLQSIVARNVQVQVELRPNAMLRSLDRVRPFITPVPV
ncbi:MAG: VWA domain-containing protein, partial [Chloroflexaceae bacterium]|nr:VWA domain-containing protein [Chloroflexaceae bacterium]